MNRFKSGKETVNYKGIDIEVLFNVEFYDSGDYDTPPSGGEIEIEDVLHKGESIYDLVAYIKDFESDIVDLLLEKM
ncbi:MAG TPA: hypothetical protein DCS17_02830 [Flavobacterium sp.]|nr:hypothetical protein [Flavobacterium sp.]